MFLPERLFHLVQTVEDLDSSWDPQLTGSITTFGKLLDLFQPQMPYLWNVDKTFPLLYLTGLLWWLGEMIYLKVLCKTAGYISHTYEVLLILSM